MLEVGCVLLHVFKDLGMGKGMIWLVYFDGFKDMIQKGKLGFWFVVGSGTIAAQIPDHDRDLHHGLAVVVSGRMVRV